MSHNPFQKAMMRAGEVVGGVLGAVVAIPQGAAKSLRKVLMPSIDRHWLVRREALNQGFAPSVAYALAKRAENEGYARPYGARFMYAEGVKAFVAQHAKWAMAHPMPTPRESREARRNARLAVKNQMRLRKFTELQERKELVAAMKLARELTKAKAPTKKPSKKVTVSRTVTHTESKNALLHRKVG